jgi:myo-inositol 2-dehydrogenase/D-chiro-inositol 1-dehydrogenase
MKDQTVDNYKTNRRSFISATGAAIIGGTIALNLGVPLYGFAGAKNTLKVGLIGCGGRGTGAAVQALTADPDVIITAMGDVFADRLEESYQAISKVFPQKLKVDKNKKFVGFDAYLKVLESDVDVVILTTPPSFRPDHFVAAINAGKHVFCEKPVAIDAPGVRKVIAAARQAKQKNLSVVSGFTFRFDTAKRALFNKVLAGDIGKVMAVSTTRNGGELWYKPRQAGWTDMEYQMRNWYYYNWLSGDFIVEMVVHSLDMMTWAMGNKMPVAATGSGGRQVRVDQKYGNIYDHFAIEYEYDNGARGFNFCRQQPGCSSRNSVEIAGTEGNAIVNLGGAIHKITGKNNWSYDGPKNNPYQTQHNELFAAIRSGKHINEGDMMANSTMLAIMSRMVAYSGQTLTWDQAFNSTQILGPGNENFSWDYKYASPPPAIPGLSKFV